MDSAIATSSADADQVGAGIVYSAGKFEVAQSSIAKYMVKRHGPPSQPWRTFLRNHAPDIAAGVLMWPRKVRHVLQFRALLRLRAHPRPYRRTIMKGMLMAAATLLVVLDAPTFAVEGSVARGQRVFGACAACHSLRQDQNMTGPSLAHLWNRKAGSLASFSRYSSAMKSANVEWNDKTLDEWIADPQHVIPGNQILLLASKTQNSVRT